MGYDFYGFDRQPDRSPQAQWAGYDGHGPAKLTLGLLAASLLWHLVRLVGALVAPELFAGRAASTAGILLTLALLGVTAVAFLTWFYRAYATVERSEGTVHPANQAVWTFFVPILNLFRPYQIATEIWRKTSPQIANLEFSPLILAWWVLWCLGRMCPFWLSTHMVQHSEQMTEPFFLAMALAEVALTISAIAVVRMLDGRFVALQGRTAAPATF